MNEEGKHKPEAEEQLGWLRRQPQRVRVLSGGDTIAAQVGESARHVAVGKNIVQIGTLKIPRFMLIGLLLAAAVVTSAIVIILVLVIPEPPPTSMDPANYNIAVATFDVIDEYGNPIEDELGLQQARKIAKFLSTDQSKLTQLLDHAVDLWVPEQVQNAGVLRKGEEDAFIKRLGAAVLLYGQIKRQENDLWEVAPAFFLADEAIGAASELRGEYALGRPIPFVPGDISYEQELNSTLKVRLSALIQMLLGLGFYARQTEDGYAKAAGHFEQLANSPEWGTTPVERSGQEIAYHFLGSAQVKLAGYAETLPDRRKERLAAGQQAFEQAIRLNPQYTRSHNGLGGVLFQLAQLLVTDEDECNWESSLLDRSEQKFMDVLQMPAVHKPAAGYVDLRANSSLGKIYFYKTYCALVDITYFDRAHKLLQEALDVYGQLPASEQAYLHDIALLNHTFLGLIEYHLAQFQQSENLASQSEVNKQFAQAAEHFSNALALVKTLNNPEVRKHGKSFVPKLLIATCMQGETDSALQGLDNFANLFPDPETVRQEMLGEVEWLLGDYSQTVVDGSCYNLE